jgi:hypothetical protein
MDKTARESSTVYVPPGFRRVLELVAAEGLDTWRDRLASGERESFALCPNTGRIFAISRQFWWSHSALEALTEGTYTRRRKGSPYPRSVPTVDFETFIVVVSDVISDRPPELVPGGDDDDVAAPSGEPAAPAVSPPEQSEPASPAVSPPEQGESQEATGPQIRRAKQALKKLFPPDGKAPDNMSTEDVRGKVNKELAPDTKNRGSADISWDTMQRALGRTRR